MDGSVRMNAFLHIDDHLNIKGMWALCTNDTKERKPGAIYDLVFCYNDKQIAYMVAQKQANNSLKMISQNVNHCARNWFSWEYGSPNFCANEKWIDEMENWVNNHSNAIQKHLSSFLKTLQPIDK